MTLFELMKERATLDIAIIQKLWPVYLLLAIAGIAILFWRKQ